MILNFTNLSNFTPTALSLIIKGANTVTKALSDVTISGDILTYTPSAAEKTSLGSGLLTVQVKLKTALADYKSEIIRLDANDLDNEVLTLLTFKVDMQKLSPEAVTGVTVNRSEFLRIGDIVYVSASFTLASQFSNNANLFTDFPSAPHIFDFPCNNPASNYARQVYLITNGTMRCAQAFPAGTYAFNGWYLTNS